MGIGLVRPHIGIGSRIIVVIGQVTEGLVLKIRPGQFPANLIHKAGFGNPVAEIRGVIKVRAIADIPGEGQGTGIDIVDWPVNGVIPGRFTTVPGFAIKATHISCNRPQDFAALVMGKHTHVGVAPVKIIGESAGTLGVASHAIHHMIRLGNSAAKVIAGTGAVDKTMTKTQGGKSQQQGSHATHFYELVIHLCILTQPKNKTITASQTAPVAISDTHRTSLG